MATSKEFIEFVCERISTAGEVFYRKMFGEYMVYIDQKPILLVCDNTVYVKRLACICDQMSDAQVGEPYPGAKLHYILDIEDADFCVQVARQLALHAAPTKQKMK